MNPGSPRPLGYPRSRSKKGHGSPWPCKSASCLPCPAWLVPYRSQDLGAPSPRASWLQCFLPPPPPSLPPTVSLFLGLELPLMLYQCFSLPCSTPAQGCGLPAGLRGPGSCSGAHQKAGAAPLILSMCLTSRPPTVAQGQSTGAGAGWLAWTQMSALPRAEARCHRNWIRPTLCGSCIICPLLSMTAGKVQTGEGLGPGPLQGAYH